MTVTKDKLNDTDAVLRKRAARLGLTLQEYKRHYLSPDPAALPHPQSWSVTKIVKDGNAAFDQAASEWAKTETVNLPKMR